MKKDQSNKTKKPREYKNVKVVVKKTVIEYETYIIPKDFLPIVLDVPGQALYMKEYEVQTITNTLEVVDYKPTNKKEYDFAMNR